MEIKKCEVCEKEVKNLGAHMHNAHASKHQDKVEQKINFVEINEKLDKIIELLTSKPEEKREIKEENLKLTAEGLKKEIEEFKTSAEEFRAPVPIDYRNAVDQVLNKSFKIEINPKTDLPAFEFIIIVPEKYSDMSANYKQMYGADKRVKVIDYASGTNGVREYAEKVFSSFNQDRKTMIVQDRIMGS